jgi:TLD
LVPFGKSFTEKWGSLFILETKKGTKFGAFTKQRMSFPNGVVDSLNDDKAILFNLSTLQAFPFNSEFSPSQPGQENSKCVHTSSKAMGLHPSIIFSLGEGKDISDTTKEVDLRISRQTVFEGLKVQSFAGLPGFHIPSTDGINQLTGEASSEVAVKKLDIWSLQ